MFGGIEAAVTGADDDDVEVETGVAHPDCCVVAVIVARRRSSRRGTAAAATFSDSTRELWGNVTPADVAELVDALVSGTSGGNIVGVQVSPSALPFPGEGPLRRHDRPEDFKRI